MSIKIIKGSYSTIIDSSTLSANQTITFPDTSGTVMVSSGTGGNLIDMFYPVGTIYMTADANFNPNTSWGGTWGKIENVFLLASGSKSVGDTGGAENVTLTTDQIPSHSHIKNNFNITGTLDFGKGLNFEDGVDQSGALYGVKGSHQGNIATRTGSSTKIGINSADGTSGSVGNTGGGQSHNNMPPYRVVAVWTRTA